MPRQTRFGTDYSGVYFVKLANQNQSFFIRYKRNGKSVEEKAGRSNHGWNAEKANQLRIEKMALICESGIESQSSSGPVEQKKLTFSKLFTEYLRLRHNLKGRANDIYRFKNYLEKEFANVTPADVTEGDVERFKHNLQNRYLKPATIRHVLELIRRLSNFGVKKKLCSGLCFKIRMPIVENHKTEELTNEQLLKLLQVLEEEADIQVRNLVRLALYTGMRRGELFNLSWSDIDFYNKTVTIKSDKKGENPKIPLNEMAEKVLIEHIQTENDSTFVFPGRGGKKRTECKRPLLRIKKKAGLPDDFRILQGLRHVYASMLASSGKVNLETLQILLTHKSQLMTKRYAPLLKKSFTNSENMIAVEEKNFVNTTEEELFSDKVNVESYKKEFLEIDIHEEKAEQTDIHEEKMITKVEQLPQQESDFHGKVFPRSFGANKQEKIYPEHIVEGDDLDAEEGAFFAENATKESAEKAEYETSFQSLNESTENAEKVQEKESQEDESSHSVSVYEKSLQSDNVFAEFFKQTKALKNKKENVLLNFSNPSGKTGFTNNLDSKPTVEDMSEEDSIKDFSDNRDIELEELEKQDDKNEKISNEPNHNEINVSSALEDVSILNEKEVEEEVVENRACEHIKNVSEDTIQNEVKSTDAVNEQNKIFNTQSTPKSKKVKQEVVVIQSFKKDFPLNFSADDGANASDKKTDVNVEDKTRPKVRPSIKELKTDLISLSKLIKAAPRRVKKNSDQKKVGFESQISEIN